MTKCGCERGDRCTPSTLCTVQSAVEDATELHDSKMEDLEIVLNVANESIAELETAFHIACGTISTMSEWLDKHPMDVSDEYLRLAKLRKSDE